MTARKIREGRVAAVNAVYLQLPKIIAEESRAKDAAHAMIRREVADKSGKSPPDKK